MLRCFSSLGCPELSLDETFALAARHCIPAVELRALGGTVELPAYFEERFGSPERLAQHLRTEGTAVRVIALNASLHLVGATAAEREQLLALAVWAEALGVPSLRVFDGGRHASAAELAEATATWDWWQAIRRARGWRVDLVVETHDSLLTAAAINRLLAANPETRILWDSHHTWRKGGEDPLTTWQSIRNHVVHIHVKDSVDRPSARHPFTYVLPGDGEFPQAQLLERLQEDGFAGYVSLEWERMWHPYLPSLEEALRVAAQRRWW